MIQHFYSTIRLLCASFTAALVVGMVPSAAQGQTLDIEGAMRSWHDIIRYSTGVTTTPLGEPNNPTTLLDPLPFDLETQVAWPRRVDKTKAAPYEPVACFYADDLGVAPDGKAKREELLVKYLAQRIYNNLNAVVIRRFDPNATSALASDPLYYAPEDDYTLDVWTAINNLDQDDDAVYAFPLYTLLKFKHKPASIEDSPLDPEVDESWTRIDADSLANPDELFNDSFRTRYKDLIRRYYLSDLMKYVAQEQYGSAALSPEQWWALQDQFSDANFDDTFESIPDAFFNEFDFGGYTEFNYRIRFEALVDHWLNRDAEVVFGNGTHYRGISRTSYVSQFLGGVNCGNCSACQNGCLHADYDFGVDVKIDLGETCLKSVGQLILKSDAVDQPLSELASPGALRYWVNAGSILIWSEDEVDRTGNPQLMQVAVAAEQQNVNHDPFQRSIIPLHLVDVVENESETGFSVSFYKGGTVDWGEADEDHVGAYIKSGNDYTAYPITGEPYQVIEVEYVAADNELHVKEFRDGDGGATLVNHFAYSLDTSGNITWRLIENPDDNAGRRVTEIIYEPGDDENDPDYREAVTVKVDNVVGVQTVTDYQLSLDSPTYGHPTKVKINNSPASNPFTWQNDLNPDEMMASLSPMLWLSAAGSVVWTSGVDPEEMYYGYYGDGLSVDDPRYGLLKYEYNSADRSWTYYDYQGTYDADSLDGFPLRVITPYKGGPSGYDPTSGDLPFNEEQDEPPTNVRIYESSYNAGNVSFLSPGSTSATVKMNREIIYDGTTGHVASLSYDVFREVDGETWRSNYQASVSATESVDFYGDSTWTTTAWSTPGNIASHTISFDSGTFAGRPKKQINADGTVVLYSYTLTADGGLETIVKSGVLGDDGETLSSGTVTTSVTDAQGSLVMRDTYDVESGITIDSMVNDNPDSRGRYQNTYYLNGTSSSRNYDCCNLQSQTSPDGTVTTYTYDNLDRLKASETNGITTIYEYDAGGRQTKIYRAHGAVDIHAPEGGNVRLVSQREYDISGELLYELDELGRKTVTERKTYDSGESESITRVYSDASETALLAESISTFMLDGSTISTSGQSAYPAFYEHGVVTDESNNQRTALLWTKMYAGADNTATEWTTLYSDMLGRNVKTVKPNADGSGTVEWTNEYNEISQLIKSTDPDGVTTLYAYNDEGELTETAVDVNRNGVIDDSDRRTRSVSGYEVDPVLGAAAVTRSYIFTDIGEELVGTSARGVGAVSYEGGSYQSGSRTESYGVQTISLSQIDVANQKVTSKTILADGNSLIQEVVAGLPQFELNTNTGEQVNYLYDDWRRLEYQYTARQGSDNKTQYIYDAVDRIDSIVSADPDPNATGPGKDPVTVSYTYTDRIDDGGSPFNGLRTVAVTSPSGQVDDPGTAGVDESVHTVTSGYDMHGQVVLQAGGFNYPVGYQYNDQGRLSIMTTWQDYGDGLSSSGAANTYWDYSKHRGYLIKKRYNNSSGENPSSEDPGVVYDYTPAGRLAKRTWARGIETVYGYTKAGELESIDYSDETPDIVYGYDRAGRLKSIDDAAGSRQNYYDRGRLTSERYTYGDFKGVSINREFDSLNRLSGLSVRQPSTNLQYEVDYGYDNASRLKTVTSGDNAFTYAYLPNTSQIETLTTSNGMVTTREYDLLNRLLSIGTVTAADVTRSFAYTYNDAGQRTSVTHENGEYWDYTYDSLGQVTSGIKKDAGGTPLPGRTFTYGFDDIGNRETATLGAPTPGQRDYTPNLLNQYTQIDSPNPATLMVEGSIDPAGTLTVDGKTPSDPNLSLDPSTGEWTYTKSDIDTTNGDYLTINASGQRQYDSNGDGNTETFDSTESRDFFMEPEVVEPAYDADGNLLSDGRWNYVWNGENRLVEMTPCNTDGEMMKLIYTYDSIGRRILREKHITEDGEWVEVHVCHYLFNGWEVVFEFEGSAKNITFAHYWGLDIAGGLQSVGSVGGLLLSEKYSNHNGVLRFSIFDGGGNITSYVEPSGELIVSYDYGPMGEKHIETSLSTIEVCFNFSTKYEDVDTGHLYYGYRYYDPTSGRWLSRDHIGESGGFNVYVANGNDFINFIDVLGLNVVPQILIDIQRDLDLNDSEWRDLVGLYNLLEKEGYSLEEVYYNQKDNYLRAQLGEFYQLEAALSSTMSPVMYSVEPYTPQVGDWKDALAAIPSAMAHATVGMLQESIYIGNRMDGTPTIPDFRQQAGAYAFGEYLDWYDRNLEYYTGADLNSRVAIGTRLAAELGGGYLLFRMSCQSRSTFTGSKWDSAIMRGETLMDPNIIRYSQRRAGGGSPPRAPGLREQISKGWDPDLGPIDIIDTGRGYVTLDNTRVAIAQELGIRQIAVRIRKPTDLIDNFPPGRMEFFEGKAKKLKLEQPTTFGDLLEIRTLDNRLSPTGTATRPAMPQ
ncbi:RHS repeat-associated core domain-containing protein [Cerasicoccus maritimus]|uniref:RHS repeat-associated core domain-containing protein n=1 Tax=Cerasicoccus maritimus TaxID=490089 RepID=UPI0028526352|nr:RHS repeat-associated core domain-containing protein [Cerasicoccus maritimus]